MRYLVGFICVLALGVISATGCGDDCEGFGIIQGTVSTGSSFEVPMHLVTPDEAWWLRFRTRGDGWYELRLPPGDYELSVGLSSQTHYCNPMDVDVTLHGGEVLELDFLCQPTETDY